MNSSLYTSRLRSLSLINRGKTRDLYDVNEQLLLFINSDRMSVYDVVLPTPIPEKGRLMTRLNAYWMQRCADIIPSHLTDIDPISVVAHPYEQDQVTGRSVVVQRCQPLPVMGMVRHYLAGGEALIEPEFMLRPASQSSVQGLSPSAAPFPQVTESQLEQIRQASLQIYRRAYGEALALGVIIADANISFGLNGDGDMVLIGELLTPNTARIWPARDYGQDEQPESLAKQAAMDYLEHSGWDGRSPPPQLTAEVVQQSCLRYHQLVALLVGDVV